MSKRIEPSIRLQSFNCPRCGALAHQNWYKVYADEAENNFIHIWDNKNYEEIVEKNKEFETPLDEDTLSSLKRLSNGEMFLERRSSSKYADYDVSNVYISHCFSCKEISLWLHDTLIFPAEAEAEEVNPDMPSEIRRDYEEARIVFKYSPRGSAALLRLCIEKLCNFLEAEGADLDKKIGYLVNQGLSKDIQKALDIVRVIGNEAVHPGQIDLNDNKDIARALFKLVNQVVQELISDQKEIDSIYKILPDSKREAIAKRDERKLG